MSNKAKQATNEQTAQEYVDKILANTETAIKYNDLAIGARLDSVALLDLINPEWHLVPTFDPDKVQNADRPKADRAINSIRIAITKMAVSAATGKKVKNAYNEWSHLKAVKAELIAPPSDDTGNASSTGTKKNYIEMLSIRNAMTADKLSERSKEGWTNLEAELAPIVNQLSKLMIKYKVRTK